MPPFVHLVDEFAKGIDSGGPYVIAHYYFDEFVDSNSVLDQLKGTVVKIGEGTFRSLPHAHPQYPWLFCVAARCLGVGEPRLNPSGYPDYKGGFAIEAEYRAGVGEAIPAPGGNESDHQIDPAEPILWCTQDLDFGTEAVIIPHHSYYWAAAGGLADVPLKIEIPIVTMTLTYHRLPYLPMAKIRGKVGFVNDAPLLGCNAETILFPGAKTIRDVSSDGSITQKVQVVTKYKPTGWNRFLRKDALVWDELVDSAGNKPYKSTDLSVVLRM